MIAAFSALSSSSSSLANFCLVTRAWTSSGRRALYRAPPFASFSLVKLAKFYATLTISPGLGVLVRCFVPQYDGGSTGGGLWALLLELNRKLTGLRHLAVSLRSGQRDAFATIISANTNLRVLEIHCPNRYNSDTKISAILRSLKNVHLTKLQILNAGPGDSLSVKRPTLKQMLTCVELSGTFYISRSLQFFPRDASRLSSLHLVYNDSTAKEADWTRLFNHIGANLIDVTIKRASSACDYPDRSLGMYGIGHNGSSLTPFFNSVRVLRHFVLGHARLRVSDIEILARNSPQLHTMMLYRCIWTDITDPGITGESNPFDAARKGMMG